MKIHTFILAAMLSALIGLLPMSAMAQGKGRGHGGYGYRNSYSPDEARQAREQGQVLGASEVMRIVMRQYPHLRPADAMLIGGSNPQYIVKMLSSDNRVVEVVVDARTGRILGTRGY